MIVDLFDLILLSPPLFKLALLFPLLVDLFDFSDFLDFLETLDITDLLFDL